ncbi:anti-sigma-F factor Fin [Chryseomicrobium palamuruense]|uniref:Anti-sigma-F factor Fin n=1 Tax=Chryseomicrobium palamuruense TaxID=682973 RepID=A0ABV8UXN7_9BACL
MIRSRCKHCRQETAAIPYEAFTDVLAQVNQSGSSWQPELMEELPGAWVVDGVCLPCRQAMEQNPLYFTLNKWIQ